MILAPISGVTRRPNLVSCPPDENSRRTPEWLRTARLPLVTGGGSGIGKASALALAREGFAVIVAGRRQEPLDAVVGQIEGLQGRALGVSTDVGNPASVEALFKATKEKFGRLDVLFNNAGFGAAGLLEDLEFAKWNGVIGSIVHGTFLCTQQAFRMMKEQNPMGGRIINNGSISAHAPRPNSIAYIDRQARRDRPHQIWIFARRPQIRHLVQPGRCRQRSDRDDPAHDPWGSSKPMARP